MGKPQSVPQSPTGFLSGPVAVWLVTVVIAVEGKNVSRTMEATKARPKKLRVLHHFARARGLSPGFQTGNQGVHCKVNEAAKVS